MKLFPVLPILWPSLLTLLGPYKVAEGNNSDICNEQIDFGEFHMQDSEGNEDGDVMTNEEETFICLLYPSKKLDCSWSIPSFEKGSHLSISVSVCNDNSTIQSMNNTSVESVGSASWTLSSLDFFKMMLRYNMSLNDKWTSYTLCHGKNKIVVTSPPTNVSASVKDGDLYVTWTRPHSQGIPNNDCFEHELYIDDQESSKIIQGQEFYKKPITDCTRTYSVRIRTRIRDTCYGSAHWSDWSSIVTVEPSAYKFNPLVIILICLGVPMILLAMLLLVRSQRVTKVLFPEIPRPPEKYKNFLEKYDTLTFFHPVLTSKPEEEITEVDDTSFLRNISIQELP